MIVYASQHDPHSACTSAQGMMMERVTRIDILHYFETQKEHLFVNQSAFHPFSFHQEYYLFSVDTDNRECQRFKRSPCNMCYQLLIPRHTRYGVHWSYRSRPPDVVAMSRVNNRVNRLDRFPYHLQRWKGRMSVAIMCEEKEVPLIASFLERHLHRSGIVFTVYVRKPITRENTPYYLLENRTRVALESGVFPHNFLRLLAIESISTTHYISIDGDIFLSSSLQSTIEQNAAVLTDYHNALVLQLFIPAKQTVTPDCLRRNNCSHMYCSFRFMMASWNQMPMTKETLTAMVSNGTMAMSTIPNQVLVSSPV